MIIIKKLQVDKTENAGKKIARRKLLTQVGIMSAGLPLLPLIYGIAHGRFDYTTQARKFTLKGKDNPIEIFRVLMVRKTLILSLFTKNPDHLIPIHLNLKIV